MPSAITLSGLGYRLSDTEILTRLTATIPLGLTGLVGDNGIGKSTLARLLTGALAPTTGTVTGAAGAVHIDQLLPHTDDRVDAILGIDGIRTSLHRALHGEAAPADFDIIGEDWDIEERALSALAEVGLALTADDLDRRASTFSGGEAMRIGLARAAMVGSAWLILDEPSNNLDAAGRALLTELLARRPGPTLVISHDRELLDAMTTIVEMTDQLRVYGGNYTAYEEMVAAEEEAKLARLTDAKKAHAIEKRQRIDLETTLARSDRKAAKDKASKRRPKIVMNGLTDFAQKSAAKRRGDKAADEAAAAAAVQTAKDALRRDSSITLHLPETEVHPSKRVLEVRTSTLERPRTLVGPERIRLTGPNGAGKSTLLAAVRGAAPTADGDSGGLGGDHGDSGGPGSGSLVDELFPGLELQVSVPIGHLDQQYRLPAALSVMEAVRRPNPGLEKHRIHEVLAAMGLRAERTAQLCGTLSGGERFRVALAATLLSDPAPQLLILDEPGNNLDVASQRALTSALEGYGGAMLVVTHDDRLAADLCLDAVWEVHDLRGEDDR
ncbi:MULTISPECIES: ATP-binding cassette domain-containing protein [unclassified Brevibacterium]|uniref:ATP-binding cassette domain-containing protein n=1 Tax=unclassified Brevibacterium TaxID=2614124 RepID=UPI0010F43D5C|nr:MULTISPECIES: ATP-binding cassette domain-containing protein [unclassified Brevibacterium]MCM1012612.1 ATP-binding cassette domain-containing protein [Brevibacterium sp. XM4083]